jgi:peptidoglycan/xylan/chitin deacetylase (PgdA/CDA1 family)
MMNTGTHFIFTVRKFHTPACKRSPLILAVILCISALAMCPGVLACSQSSERRQVAVTFDDLPISSVTEINAASRKDITDRLLRIIRSQKIPAIGFVNEYELYGFQRKVVGTPDESGILLLQMWLEAKVELGNHTFAHMDLHQVSVSAFKDDVVSGEIVTRKLMRQKGMQLRYFRHPYLHAGKDLDTKQEIERFLTRRGYRVVPVTIDNEDYMFAAAYSRAIVRGDKQMMQRIASEYISYTERVFDYSERLSAMLFGRQIKHILLLHANALNADYFSQLAQVMKKRGYSFVSVDEALRDNAYASRDTYIGGESLNWLTRWAITRGVKSMDNALDDFPDVPDFVVQAVETG